MAGGYRDHRRSDQRRGSERGTERGGLARRCHSAHIISSRRYVQRAGGSTPGPKRGRNRPQGNDTPGVPFSRREPESTWRKDDATTADQQGSKPPRVQEADREDGAAEPQPAATGRDPTLVACYHPLTAWRTPGGAVELGKEPRDGERMQLACGGCIGCRMDRAKEWALRCSLEMQQHRKAVFTTLTYDEAHLPPTLSRRHLQLWLKRLRKASGPNRPLRFFAAGEYGETTNRPHYHAIVYGLGEADGPLIQETWRQGFTRTEKVTPARIAYVAGYAAKKIGWKLERGERVDPETGEVYEWEPPFVQMSRRPGIGGHARQWPQSWRDYAVMNGRKSKVPRFLHMAWEAQATIEQMEELAEERRKKGLLRDTSKARREAGELLAIARQRMQAERRKL